MPSGDPAGAVVDDRRGDDEVDEHAFNLMFMDETRYVKERQLRVEQEAEGGSFRVDGGEAGRISDGQTGAATLASLPLRFMKGQPTMNTSGPKRIRLDEQLQKERFAALRA